MFESEDLYSADSLPENFTTFADLGCNVGYFSCWLAHQAHGRPLQGMMIDANPAAVTEARWHAQINSWQDIHAIHGVIGDRSGRETTDFFLYESNICSMARLPDAKALDLKGRWTRISAPCVSLSQTWKARFNDQRCHVLKIDIEGAELDLLQAEETWLQTVDVILLEWHRWRVQLPEIREFLAQANFKLVKVLKESEKVGTAVFRHKTSQGSPQSRSS